MIYISVGYACSDEKLIGITEIDGSLRRFPSE